MPETIKAYQLDWPPITVEGYSEQNNEAVMIFNCDITTDDKAGNVIHYAIGRTAWACQNLPLNTKIKLRFDIRGQQIPVGKADMFNDRLSVLINNLQLENPVLIDIVK
ncbi:hypothetical protein [Mucilaginibacter celer]|uniref:Uncharacterized protein n=1 Tax=Mucilaginibacter celer TaxID=2305508 RepID=A0A494VQK5_9SPHI|nr:hypothetical protein [Mucilaginibacter celer]AYL97837.1 hypothetical protein HYN43_022190 [Mucilaginibacter celer]